MAIFLEELHTHVDHMFSVYLYITYFSYFLFDFEGMTCDLIGHNSGHCLQVTVLMMCQIYQWLKPH